SDSEGDEPFGDEEVAFLGVLALPRIGGRRGVHDREDRVDFRLQKSFPIRRPVAVRGDGSELREYPADEVGTDFKRRVRLVSWTHGEQAVRGQPFEVVPDVMDADRGRRGINLRR